MFLPHVHSSSFFPLAIETDDDVLEICPPPDPSLLEEEVEDVETLIVDPPLQFQTKTPTDLLGTMLANKMCNMLVRLFTICTHIDAFALAPTVQPPQLEMEFPAELMLFAIKVHVSLSQSAHSNPSPPPPPPANNPDGEGEVLPQLVGMLQ